MALLLSLMVVGGLMAQAEAPMEKSSFVLILNGAPAGYHSYSLAPVKEGWELSAHTYMKVNVLGKQETMEFWEYSELDPAMLPIDYKLSISANGNEQHISAHFTDDSIELVLPSGKKSLPKSGEVHLLENNMIDHYAVLVKGIKLNKKENKKTISVVIPQVGLKTDASFLVGGEKEVLGTTARHIGLKMSGIDIDLWVEPKSHALLKMEVPSQNFVAERRENLDTTRFADAEYVKLLSMDALFVKTNEMLEHPYTVDQLTLDGDFYVSVPDTSDIYLDPIYQAFDGTVKDYHIKGLFRLYVHPYVGKGWEFPPPADVAEKYAEYLKSTSDFPSDDSLIAATAARLTTKDTTVWQAIKHLNRFVADSLKYELTGAGAVQALKTRKGDCGPKSLLLVSLLRAVGIPARLVGGLLYTNGYFGQHNWVEAQVGKSHLWLPIDPTTGEDEHFSAIHITLWKGMGTIAPGKGKMKAEIIEYNERLEK